jgi:type 2 lantibiotic biosynthesis protein LanM
MVLDFSAAPGNEAFRESWLHEAVLLGDQLWSHARRTPSGKVIWLDPSSARNPNGSIVPLGPQLYGGVTGVVLFLAALQHVTGEDGQREVLLEVLEPVRRPLLQLASDPEGARQVPAGLGGFAGLGAYIYGFLLLGRWLGLPELRDEAAAVATLLTPERIAADEGLDVLGGCAGAVLALLHLDRATRGASRGGATPLERAVACGEHLLDRRVSVDGRPRAWPANGQPPACSFAHGATGIACALLRLYERTGEARFRKAAEEGLAYERLFYDSERGNWRVPSLPEPSFITSWCHGAPGIALGRLRMLGLFDGPEDRRELRGALEATLQSPEAARDFLCCGDMGKADVLLDAYEILGEERLLAAAGRIAARVVARSRDAGGSYRWFAPGDDRFSPSFFRGAAGVGYALLRLARPSSLPCVLALDGIEAW